MIRVHRHPRPKRQFLQDTRVFANNLILTFRLTPNPNSTAAQSFLESHLSKIPSGQHYQILSDLQSELEKTGAADCLLHHIVTELKAPYDRSSRASEKLRELWGTVDFIPAQYRPESLSRDLLHELYMLSTESQAQQIPLPDLWADASDGGIIPTIMQQSHITQARKYVTPAVIKRARQHIKELVRASEEAKSERMAADRINDPSPNPRSNTPDLSEADEGGSVEAGRRAMLDTPDLSDADEGGSIELGRRAMTDLPDGSMSEDGDWGGADGYDTMDMESHSLSDDGDPPSKLAYLDKNVSRRQGKRKLDALQTPESDSSLRGQHTAESQHHQGGSSKRSTLLGLQSAVTVVDTETSAARIEVPFSTIRRAVRSMDKDNGLDDVAVNIVIRRLTVNDSLRLEYAAQIATSEYAAPQGFSIFSLSKPIKIRQSKASSSSTAFDAWFRSLEAQRHQVSYYGNAIAVLQSRHRNAMTCLDDIEQGYNDLQKEKSNNSQIKSNLLEGYNAIQPLLLCGELLQSKARLQSLTQLIDNRLALQKAWELREKRALANVYPALVQMKVVIVLCRVIGPLFLASKDKMLRMEQLQREFLEKAQDML